MTLRVYTDVTGVAPTTSLGGPLNPPNREAIGPQGFIFQSA